MSKLDATPTQLGLGVFYFRNQRESIGAIILFVNDIVWAWKFKKIFHVESENLESFTYVGISVQQNQDKSIITWHQNFKDSLQQISSKKDQLLHPKTKQKKTIITKKWDWSTKSFGKNNLTRNKL